MRKAEEIVGLPVINRETGQQLGVVRDIYFDEKWTIRGVAMETKTFIRRNRFIPSEQIGAIGEDCLVVENEDQIKPMDYATGFHSIFTGKKKLKGIPAILGTGMELGLVEDVYFMEEMGTIIGYELSDGLISDLTEGRRVIKRPRHVMFGDDALVVEQEKDSY
ncbi:PRC-barrel domain-containing protein [Microaerobacter geothermalis]|uniref:PRC-barrel domain-containing protein n=1 Tax=Microaerobacter geothermalis TaxID=674972 RepID=UPI001F3D2A8C|nr:PRC-barrel domain-containing protein [Microaerobacter geothermalis]MCF6093988.1 PRC-barrel domain-containing protein [Microaerobacter geothermalis]